MQDGSGRRIADLVRDAISVGMTPREFAEEYDFPVEQADRQFWLIRNAEHVRAGQRRRYVPIKREVVRMWTSVEDARLLRMTRDGLSFRQIARALGRSRNSVAGRLHRLRIDGVSIEHV